MSEYVNLIYKAYKGYWNYLVNEILHPDFNNFFYGLLLISLVVWGLELIFPWRKQQSIFRKDFWLDAFYMFFNFFIFNLIAFAALSATAEALFNDVLGLFSLSLDQINIINLNTLPKWLGLLVFFVVSDFTQWNTHRLLHRVDFLWQFHKVHHSVKEMGFAAHLRYHWMETIVYKTLLYIPLAVISGLSANDLVVVHFFTIAIGHLNHANLGWDYGILKYIFNNPKMHIWHHSKTLPVRHGVNFGLTLSIWDYIFKTNYVPHNGMNNELGFTDDNTFPKDFINQEIYPLKFKK